MCYARFVLPILLLAQSSVLAQHRKVLAADGLERVREEIPGLVAERMIRGNLPGVAIVLVAGEDVIYARGFGRKNLAYPDPIGPDSVFRVASVTKQFVAMACLLLEQEGKLKLNDPVVKHLPWLRTADGKQNDITIGQLLSHQSGLPRGPYYASRHGSVREQVEDLARMKLAYEPGTAFKYSNTGYNLAGYLVETVSGMDFQAFMRERILNRLGMAADFQLSAELSNRYATGYMTDHYRSFVTPGDRLVAAPLYPAPVAAGQLYASALDVSRFLRCLLNRGRFKGVELVSERLFARMVRPYDAKLSGYGLGLGTSKLFGETVFQHTGGYYGHSSIVIGFPDLKLGGVVIINRASSHHENRWILHHALALLLGKDVPGPKGDPSLAGRYLSHDMDVEVVARGEELYLLDDGRSFRLEPYYGSTSRYIPSGGRLRAWPVDFEPNRLVAGPVVLYREGKRPSVSGGVKALDLEPYCGTYRDDDFGEVVVFLRDGKLYYAFSKMEQVELERLRDDRFRITAGSFRGEPAVFRRGEGGVVGLEAAYMYFKRGSF